VTWEIKNLAVEDYGRCTKRFAQNARRNAKSLLNPKKTVQYIARIAFQSVRTKGVKRIDFVGLFRI